MSTNTPFVVRKGASDWKVVREWDVETLREVMGGRKVKVAVTGGVGKGKADSLLRVRSEMLEGDGDRDGEGGGEGGGKVGGNRLQKEGGDERGDEKGDEERRGEVEKEEREVEVEEGEGEWMFLTPHEQEIDFSVLIDELISQEREAKEGKEVEEVWYGQSRKSFISPTPFPPLKPPCSILNPNLEGNNIPTEYAPLQASLPPTIPFASLALDQSAPDATNIWLGNSLSTSSLHRDPYQNIYVQVLGQKHFVLLSPVGAVGAGERMCGTGRWVRTVGEGGNGEDAKWRVRREGGEVPWAGWDPDDPDDDDDDDGEGGKRKGVGGNRYSKYLKPMRVTLQEGDMLYLPALWYAFSSALSSSFFAPFL